MFVEIFWLWFASMRATKLEGAVDFLFVPPSLFFSLSYGWVPGWYQSRCGTVVNRCTSPMIMEEAESLAAELVLECKCE